MPFEWFKKLFASGPGSTPSPQTKKSLPDVRWLEPGEAGNPWGVRVLDVRPVTHGMISTSSNVQCAQNSMSFGNDDGTCFIGVEPEDRGATAADLRYRLDGYLADGAMFRPRQMEQKWAIFLHRRRILFVRSWTRSVMAVADVDVRPDDGELCVTSITGSLGPSADPNYVPRVADFLIRTHAMGLSHPAPLPPEADRDPKEAALMCFSLFGNLAAFATHERVDAPVPTEPLRADSLLHFAVARDDAAGVAAQLDAGIPVNVAGRGGLTPLHWAVGYKSDGMIRLLLERGADVDVWANGEMTPLMMAADQRDAERAALLLSLGANANAGDDRGFTPLHRAAETGQIDLVRSLLAHGADPSSEAQGHTPVSLARSRDETAIVDLLTRSAS